MVACELEVGVDEVVKVSENLLLWKGIEKSHQVVVDVGVVGGWVVLFVWWKGGQESVKKFKGVGHGCESHGLLPYSVYDLIDDHGGGSEKFGHDGLFVVEDGAPFEKCLFGFQENLASR